MTYLFDTNAWIRAIERPDELTSSANAVLLNPASAPYGLSAISIYEIGQKARKGKLALAIPIDRWLSIALRPALVQVIPIDAVAGFLTEWTQNLVAPQHSLDII